ncbi:phosphatase PAP2 family protein [Pseudodesulfovibrio cashew]|uniref:Phosphatase PAP2 family protein n=1 Tax=Pseudodesulfovibrio cashew TaxID=2678688 RepID=A0A6I6JFR6_9BACT|nr:phosphatase PAP2 family protein [Pseudodesulfovibrio cashew]QGY41675.1 phosphatase PAP2 family protein [Pseudodesulfovibrio cashew]
MFFQNLPLDLDTFLFINQYLRCQLLDAAMPLFSSMGALLVLLAAALALALLFGGKRQIVFFLVLLAGMGVTDFTSNLVKKQVNRIRPLNAVAETYYQDNGDWKQRPSDFKRTKEVGRSYPSAHSANSMCLAVLAMLIWPALKRWPLVLPLLVGYSRIYLGKHYPTDVLAGWLYGVVTALAVWVIWQYGVRRFLPGMRRS